MARKKKSYNGLVGYALQIEVGQSFFAGFGHRGRLKTAFQIHGAMLFPEYETPTRVRIIKKLEARGKRVRLARVTVDFKPNFPFMTPEQVEAQAQERAS